MVELYINRIKSFQKNNILVFIFGYFYLPFFCPGQKKVDPYFRENESSEASGIIRICNEFVDFKLSTDYCDLVPGQSTLQCISLFHVQDVCC